MSHVNHTLQQTTDVNVICSKNATVRMVTASVQLELECQVSAVTGSNRHSL